MQTVSKPFPCPVWIFQPKLIQNPERRTGVGQFSLKTLKAGLHAQSFPVPHRHLLDGAAKRTPSKPRPRSSCSPDGVETGQGNFHLLSALRSCPTLNHGLSTEGSKDTSSQMQIVYSGAPSAPSTGITLDFTWKSGSCLSGRKLLPHFIPHQDVFVLGGKGHSVFW